jgi:hypothetical protein
VRAPAATALVGTILTLMTGCAASGSSVEMGAATASAVSGALRVDPSARSVSTGSDAWDVFVCEIPETATDASFGALPLRLDLSPEEVAAIVNRHVTEYFATLSHGQYQPVFTAVGVVTIRPSDPAQACVDTALAQAAPTANGVLVVGNAEQAEGQPGGFATIGEACDEPPCSAAETGRAVYVGASDFNPSWGDRPPMDLVEHELGHALGWPHSGYDETQQAPHRSGLDVMSDSAAPRQIDADRRDAPDTLAINRVASGWLPVTDVVLLSPPDTTSATSTDGQLVQLEPSTGPKGVRLAVVPLGVEEFLTIEWLSADGYNDHLPHAGIAVHHAVGAGASRTLTPVVGTEPYLDLLDVGESVDTNGVRITVLAAGRVSVMRS